MWCKNKFMFKRFFIYGCIGICLEILWTGLGALAAGDTTLTGHSSVIMFPIYGAAVLMEPVFVQLRNSSFILRGIIYGVLIFAAEYFSGLWLTALNICPWSYNEALLNIRGVIRLDYMPLWSGVGLMYERVYKVFLKKGNIFLSEE